MLGKESRVHSSSWMYMVCAVVVLDKHFAVEGLLYVLRCDFLHILPTSLSYQTLKSKTFGQKLSDASS